MYTYTFPVIMCSVYSQRIRRTPGFRRRLCTTSSVRVEVPIVPAELSQLLGQSLLCMAGRPAPNQLSPQFQSSKSPRVLKKPPYRTKTAEGTLKPEGRTKHGNPYAVPSNRGSAATREAVIFLLPGLPLVEDIVRVSRGKRSASCHPQPGHLRQGWGWCQYLSNQTKRQTAKRIYFALQRCFWEAKGSALASPTAVRQQQRLCLSRRTHRGPPMQTDERRRASGGKEAMPPRELSDAEWQHSFVPILKLAGTNKAAKDPRARENAVGDVKHIMVSARS